MDKKIQGLEDRVNKLETLLYDLTGKVNTLSLLDTTLENNCEKLISKNMEEIKSSGEIDTTKTSGPKPDNIKKFFTKRMLDSNYTTEVPVKKNGKKINSKVTYERLFGKNNQVNRILKDKKYEEILDKITDETKREERKCGLIWEILNEYEGFDKQISKVKGEYLDYKNKFKEEQKSEENSEL